MSRRYGSDARNLLPADAMPDDPSLADEPDCCPGCSVQFDEDVES